jgi:hypothetical protein
MIIYLYLLLGIFIIMTIFYLTWIKWHFDYYKTMENSCL